MKRFKRPNHYIREGPKQIQKAIAQFLLPLVSIVIEKVIHNQTENFLGKNKILYKYQSGFSKSFSTNSCLTLLTDKINKGFQFGKDTGLILIDLEKAFHTTDHEILLKKMVCIGFQKNHFHGLSRIYREEPLKLILIKSFRTKESYLRGSPRIYIRSTFVFVIRPRL